VRDLIKEGDRIRTVINQSSLTNVFSTVLDLHRTYYHEGIFVAQSIITVMIRSSCRRGPWMDLEQSECSRALLAHVIELRGSSTPRSRVIIHHVALDGV